MADLDIDEKDINDRDLFDEFNEATDISLQQILVSMISDKENISLKTEINNPEALTFIYMFQTYVKLRGYEKYGKFLLDSINIYLEYMVSNKRKSRKEIERILSSWYEKQFTSRDTQLTVKSVE